MKPFFTLTPSDFSCRVEFIEALSKQARVREKAVSPPLRRLCHGAECRKGPLPRAGCSLRMKPEHGPRSPPVYSQSSGMQAVHSPDHQTPDYRL